MIVVECVGFVCASISLVVWRTTRLVDRLDARDRAEVQAHLTMEADRARLKDPDMCRSLRDGIAKRRAILVARREIYFSSWKNGRYNKSDWIACTEIDDALVSLAKEESKIPLAANEVTR
jgi:hypothetical protein